MRDAPNSVPLLPGERLLLEQPLKREYAELNPKNLPATAARCAPLLLFPASLCVFMATELFSLIWLGLLGGVLVVETVCYVRRKSRSSCSVRVTSERVICMQQEGAERRCRVYPHRCLSIQSIGTKLWFYAGADEHIPMVDAGENARRLARLIRRETGAAAPATPEPLDERHPLLPEGELLYATGQYGKKKREFVHGCGLDWGGILSFRGRGGVDTSPGCVACLAGVLRWVYSYVCWST